jgi:hypothetical protein
LPRGNLVFTLVAASNLRIWWPARLACVHLTCTSRPERQTSRLKVCKYEDAACASACHCIGAPSMSHSTPEGSMIGRTGGGWRSISAEKARPHHAHASCGVNRCASARPGGALAGQPCLRLTTSSAGASRTAVLGMCLTFPPLTTTSCTSNWSATQKLVACLGRRPGHTACGFWQQRKALWSVLRSLLVTSQVI